MLGYVVDGSSAEDSRSYCPAPLHLCMFSTPVLTTSTTGTALSCKCMSSQHRETGILAGVKHTVLSKPLLEKWKRISHLQKNPKDPTEASPAMCKDLGSELLCPCCVQQQ